MVTTEPQRGRSRASGQSTWLGLTDAADEGHWVWSDGTPVDYTPSAGEGFMTEKKISIVRNDHIGHLAKKMGLAKFVLLSASAEEKGVRTNLKKLGCAFEAFVGAVYVDHCLGVSNGEDEAAYDVGEGTRAARKLLEAVFERLIDWTTLISTDDNYKNQLQVLLQAYISYPNKHHRR